MIYNEYEIKEVGGEERKHQTKRGSVSIDEATAEIMNRQSKKTGIVYELAKQTKEEPEKSLKDMTKTEINRLGVPELKELAKNNEIDGYENLTGAILKEKLIELSNKLKE